MNNKTIAIFFAGVAAGFVASRWYWKNKYEKELDMELEKVNTELQKVLEEKTESDREDSTDEKTPEATPLEKKVYRHEIAKQAYDSYFAKEEVEPMKTAPIEPVDEPYVITGNEFITDQSHEKATLTYYINADVLAEDDEPLDVPATEVLGNDFVSHFHDGEDGVVYVRNNKMGVDYEVILDESSKEFVRETLGFGDA